MNSRIPLLEIYLYTGVDKQIGGEGFLAFFAARKWVIACVLLDPFDRCWFNYSVIACIVSLPLTCTELFSLLRQVIETKRS